MVTKPIKKIAIIGGGPSGLCTLNELLHTGKDGVSTMSRPLHGNPKPAECAFDEIVVFEQSDHIGGVWHHSPETDVSIPLHAEENYSKPESMRPPLVSPSAEELEKSNQENPVLIDEQLNKDLLYARSAIYDNLFTNIPNTVMKFSTSFEEKIDIDENSNRLYPFAYHQNVKNYLNKYAKDNDLEKYIRFNSVVEKVFKTEDDDMWNVVVCKMENDCQKWYQEKFDAVAVAVGRFNVPFVPKIDGLTEFNKNNSGVIMHAKEFRTSVPLKDKKVLVIGLSISAIDILQYLIPICKETHVSGNTKMMFDDDKDRIKKPDWVEEIIHDESLNMKLHSRISKFQDNKVYFDDGSVEEGFDQILFCTGYHNYFPFLNIPENQGRDFVKVTSGFKGVDNFAQTTIDNVYLYVFTIADPTLAHVGIAHNPLFFLGSEAEAVALAGVWSGTKKLPSKQEQREWMDKRFVDKVKAFQFFSEEQIVDFIKICYELGPYNRYNMIEGIQDNAVGSSKAILNDLFYKYVNKEIIEGDSRFNYNGE